jgi:hypothetical protein
LPFEFRIPAIQGQKKLFPTGCQLWQRIPGAKQFFYRVRPQTNARITRFHMKFSILLDEGSYVLTQNGDSSQGESRGDGGLAGLAFTTERDCLAPDTYGAGMERQNPTASQNKSHDWSQEIGRHILIGERRQTSSPNTFCRSIHKEESLITIGQLEKFFGSERGKHEGRVVSFNFSGPRVLQSGR